LLSVVCGNYDADLEEETRVSNVYKKLGYMWGAGDEEIVVNCNKYVVVEVINSNVSSLWGFLWLTTTYWQYLNT
jgi:hypothetical protein